MLINPQRRCGKIPCRLCIHSANHRMMKTTALTILISLLSYQLLTAQRNSEFLVIESSLAVPVGSRYADSYILGGVGIWNYWHLQDTRGRRNGRLGLSLPLRLWFSDPGKVNIPGLRSMLSVATLFRVDIQQHPQKDSWWFFIGAGPELRQTYFEETGATALSVQTEIGFKRRQHLAIISNVELGSSASFVALSPGRTGSPNLVSLFVRMGIF